MLPTEAVRLQLGVLLAANAGTLAPAADANVIALIKADFTPSEDLVVGDLTLADFTGSTPIEGATGAQQVGIDPATQDQVITIIEPVGGYRWESTNTANLPQTIYGYCLLSNDLATLLAVEKLPTPLAIQASGQFIDIGNAELRFVAQPIS